MDMTGFKYTEFTFTNDQMDEDSQRINVLWLNPVEMKTFETYDMPIFWFKGKVVIFPRNKLVLVPSTTLSSELGCECNRVLSYWEDQMTNPRLLSIETHHEKKGDFLIIPLY